jgi:hypothetical protein
MNTSKYVPYDAIAKNLFHNDLCPEYPGFAGTGFFVRFPPYSDIFYVTARHCIYNNQGLGDPDSLRILVSNDRPDFVFFDSYFDNSYLEDDMDDIIVYHVSDSNDPDVLEILNSRALRLHHQEDIEDAIKYTVNTNQRFRTVGYPEDYSSFEYIDDETKPELELTSRGFHGIAANSAIPNHYSITDTNWEGEFNGFSGSPVLIFTPIDHLRSINEDIPKEEVLVIVIGVLLLGSDKFNGVHFLNINVITDMIASYILETYSESA